MKKCLTVMILSLLLAGTVVTWAENDTQQNQKSQSVGGPWGHPDVLNAAAAIQMTPEQQAKFRAAVGAFVDGLMKYTVSLIKQQKPDIPRKLKRKTRKLTKAMNQSMSEILDEEQYPRYEACRDLLLDKMEKISSGGRRRR